MRVSLGQVAANASIPVLSHETLAEMVGTMRSRIKHFMNKFRTMGLIDYNGELTVRTEMLRPGFQNSEPEGNAVQANEEKSRDAAK